MQHPRSFSPAATARRVAVGRDTLRISLGCEAPRIGDENAFGRLIARLLEAGPVKLTARPGSPIVAELPAHADPGPDVQMLDGRVETVDGRLRVILPLAEADALPSHVSGPRAPRLNGRRFLVADDSATNRLVLTEMLKIEGAVVDCVESGGEAVALALSRDYDLLLLDIAMPGMAGSEALCAIRKAGCGTPALAVTANAMAHQIESYLRDGFSGHLAKPLRQEDLVRGVLRFLP